jgi:hypothetical protein
MKFQVPFPCSTIGCKIMLAPAAGADFTVKLYAADGTTVLQTAATHDGDIARSSGSYGFTVYWPTEQALTANTNYHIMIEPSTTNQVTLQYFDVNAAALLDQVEGGQQFHYVDNSGASGAFVATTTRRPSIGLILSAFDDGVSAGGLITHPGMAGGMRA